MTENGQEGSGARSESSEGGATPPEGARPDANSNADVIADAENPDAVKEAMRRMKSERRQLAKRLEDAEGKLKEFTERDKTELERASERAEAAERELAAVKQRDLARTVALEKGLPTYLYDRLRGSTREDLEADADKLLTDVGQSATSTATRPDLGGGPRKPPVKTSRDMDSRIRRATGRRS